MYFEKKKERCLVCNFVLFMFIFIFFKYTNIFIKLMSTRIHGKTFNKFTRIVLMCLQMTKTQITLNSFTASSSLIWERCCWQSTPASASSRFLLSSSAWSRRILLDDLVGVASNVGNSGGGGSDVVGGVASGGNDGNGDSRNGVHVR